MMKRKIEIEVDVPDGIDLEQYTPLAFGRCGDYPNDLLASFAGIVCRTSDFNPDITGLILRKVELVKRSRFVNTYTLTGYPSRADADRGAAPNRLGVVRIDLENGVPVRATLEPAP
jgi:predicted Zn-dependent protease with MMP-like domain